MRKVQEALGQTTAQEQVSDIITTTLEQLDLDEKFAALHRSSQNEREDV